MLKKSKLILLSVATTVFFAFSAPAALADTMGSLKEQQKKIEQKKENLDSEIGKKDTEIDQNKTEIQKLQDKIRELTNKIADTNGKIEQVNAEIAQTTKEIEELKVSIAKLEKKIAERDELLRERIRAVQASGGSVNYLDVLLGANSFIDFIDRFSAVNTLMEADRKILEEQAADKQSLEEQKKLVEEKRAQQEANKQKLVELKASLDQQKAQQAKLVDQLEAELAKLETEKAELEEDLHDAHQVSEELEAKIVAEQKRLAEQARKAEEERKKRLAAQKAAQSKKNSSSNKSSSGGSASPSVSSGTWTSPASGRFTSGFGGRVHPITGVYKEHRGQDIANSVGTPIYAAGDGVVSYAGSMGTYGNVIMITHSVDGEIYTTVYAHLSSIGVNVGDGVDKGQQIGGMGSTGGSTGSHLHFEFHIGNWSSKGPSAVNPWRYVPM